MTDAQKYRMRLIRAHMDYITAEITRMILTAIYQMLSTGEIWNPSDLYKIDMPAPLIEKQKAKAIKQVACLRQLI
ncbi:MAG: hypothetical protein ACOCNL_09485 [Acetivibrio ethanolgignens]